MEEGREGVSGFKTVVVKEKGRKPIEVMVPEVQEPNVWDYRKRRAREQRQEQVTRARDETLTAVRSPQVDQDAPLAKQMESEGRPPAQPPAEEKPKSLVDRLRDFLRK